MRALLALVPSCMSAALGLAAWAAADAGSVASAAIVSFMALMFVVAAVIVWRFNA